MTRLGLALGARAETFMGLSGLGDLVLTATGDLSRNRQRRPAAGRRAALPEILRRTRPCRRRRATAPPTRAGARARALGVEMPITEAVVEVLEGRVAPAQALEQLMARAGALPRRDGRVGRRQTPPA